MAAQSNLCFLVAKDLVDRQKGANISPLTDNAKNLRPRVKTKQVLSTYLVRLIFESIYADIFSFS